MFLQTTSLQQLPYRCCEAHPATTSHCNNKMMGDLKSLFAALQKDFCKTRSKLLISYLALYFFISKPILLSRSPRIMSNILKLRPFRQSEPPFSKLHNQYSPMSGGKASQGTFRAEDDAATLRDTIDKAGGFLHIHG